MHGCLSGGTMWKFSANTYGQPVDSCQLLRPPYPVSLPLLSGGCGSNIMTYLLRLFGLWLGRVQFFYFSFQATDTHNKETGGQQREREATRITRSPHGDSANSERQTVALSRKGRTRVFPAAVELSLPACALFGTRTVGDRISNYFFAAGQSSTRERKRRSTCLGHTWYSSSSSSLRRLDRASNQG